MLIIKKDGTIEEYKDEKIKSAVNKSSKRVILNLTDDDYKIICSKVYTELKETNETEIHVSKVHNVVEHVLEEFNPLIAKSYRDYRNYKKDFVHLMDEVYMESQSIRFIGDKENANTDFIKSTSTEPSVIINNFQHPPQRRT